MSALAAWIIVGLLALLVALVAIQAQHSSDMARAGLQPCRTGLLVTWQRECGR